ncbi:MAG: ketopantoate reductase family protein, partial [Candidatus Scatosoma sp.]
MKAAIYGAGAMGGTLGALIIKSGGAADLYARNEEHVAAVRQKGLTLRCEADDVTFRVDAPMFTPDELSASRKKYDVIFLMTKQRENAAIVTFLKDFLTENGVIVTTQNGLPERKIAGIIGAEKTFGGVCSFGANFSKAGEAALTSSLSSAKICVGAFERGGAAKNTET